MAIAPADPQVQAVAKMLIERAAGSAPGKWWDVWLKTRVHLEREKVSKFYVGKVQGEKADAVAMAREIWPEFVGRMSIEIVHSSRDKKGLPNARCELCQCLFPRERQRQRICPGCDFSE